MKLTQLNPTKEDMWEILKREDVYLVRLAESKSKTAVEHRESLTIKPIGSMTVGELAKLLDSGKAVIVELKGV